LADSRGKLREALSSLHKVKGCLTTIKSGDAVAPAPAPRDFVKVNKAKDTLDYRTPRTTRARLVRQAIAKYDAWREAVGLGEGEEFKGR